jgi:hypothetical protein
MVGQCGETTHIVLRTKGKNWRGYKNSRIGTGSERNKAQNWWSDHYSLNRNSLQIHSPNYPQKNKIPRNKILRNIDWRLSSLSTGIGRSMKIYHMPEVERSSRVVVGRTTRKLKIESGLIIRFWEVALSHPTSARGLPITTTYQYRIFSIILELETLSLSLTFLHFLTLESVIYLVLFLNQVLVHDLMSVMINLMHRRLLTFIWDRRWRIFQAQKHLCAPWVSINWWPPCL